MPLSFVTSFVFFSRLSCSSFVCTLNLLRSPLRRSASAAELDDRSAIRLFRSERSFSHSSFAAFISSAALLAAEATFRSPVWVASSVRCFSAAAFSSPAATAAFTLASLSDSADAWAAWILSFSAANASACSFIRLSKASSAAFRAFWPSTLSSSILPLRSSMVCCRALPLLPMLSFSLTTLLSSSSIWASRPALSLENFLEATPMSLSKSLICFLNLSARALPPLISSLRFEFRAST
mmetsp:Transcript_19847/g.39717  ORF Transcript_19847/g.39717 Transcript_19847/m.39717 type:complete len:238 (+) Transcript_19847:1317-2030(+)